ncbi:hypothetical protein AXG93_1962s1010 [Marchantia polymorpha subsp. ruderalis]|uniref:Uncharacterized protein n=1 Tax=Marchantia polymorpha subsp. ruderalis TaxID=1480154 RepID=A0A176WE99_MARPO|nr:hypothetical protein AXG93_1962s1010 [Marchantia polymorpha subsp. ruderalis]
MAAKAVNRPGIGEIRKAGVTRHRDGGCDSICAPVVVRKLPRRRQAVAGTAVVMLPRGASSLGKGRGVGEGEGLCRELGEMVLRRALRRALESVIKAPVDPGIRPTPSLSAFYLPILFLSLSRLELMPLALNLTQKKDL